MLVANSVVAALVGAITSRGQWLRGDLALLSLGSVFGLTLCWVWWQLAARGWDRYDFYFDRTRSVALPQAGNPLEAYRAWRSGLPKRRFGSTKLLSFVVIGLFAVAYALAFALAVTAALLS